MAQYIKGLDHLVESLCRFLDDPRLPSIMEGLDKLLQNEDLPYLFSKVASLLTQLDQGEDDWRLRDLLDKALKPVEKPVKAVPVTEDTKPSQVAKAIEDGKPFEKVAPNSKEEERLDTWIAMQILKSHPVVGNFRRSCMRRNCLDALERLESEGTVRRYNDGKYYRYEV